MKAKRIVMAVLVCMLASACVMLCKADKAHAAEYGVWVKGVQVTDDNKDNVLGDENATVRFETDGDTNRLVLNNANISVTDASGLHDNAVLKSNIPLTIGVIGENTISYTAADMNRDETIRGIHCVGMLNLANYDDYQSQGSLTVDMKLTQGSIDQSDSKRFDIMKLDETGQSLVVDDVKLTCNGNGGHCIFGLFSKSHIDFRNGSEFSCNIWTKNKAAGIRFDSSYTKREVNVDQSKVSFNVVGATDADGILSDIYSLYNFKLNVMRGSDFTASASGYSDMFDKYAVALNMVNSSGSGSVSVSEDSTFLLKAGGHVTTCNINRSSYTTKDTLVSKSMSGEDRFKIDNTADVTNSEYKYLTFDKMKKWDVWVSGVRVTEENYRNVLNDIQPYCAVYFPDSNTLKIYEPGQKIKAAKIDGQSFAAAIYATGDQKDLTIKLSGQYPNNVIYPNGSQITGADNVYGIYATGDLTIAPYEKSDNKKGLTVMADGADGSDDVQYTVGIKADGVINLEDVAVVVNASGGKNVIGIESPKLSVKYTPANGYSKDGFAGAKVFASSGTGSCWGLNVTSSVSVEGLAVLEASGTSCAALGLMTSKLDLTKHDVGGAFVNDETTSSFNKDSIWDQQTNPSRYNWFRVPQYEHIEAAEATCETDGNIEYWKDAPTNSFYAAGSDGSIGSAIEEASTITDTKLGHNWGDPTYVWADDHSSCTATRVCGRDASHKETETKASASEETKAPTCTEKGETTYTSATFENEAFTVQTETLADIDPLGHDWGDWAVTKEPTEFENGEKTRECARCHETETEEIPKIEPAPEPTPEPTPEPGSDPNQKGTDGTAVGAGASAASADKAITSLTSDKDPKGAKYLPLKLKSGKQTKSAVTISWTKQSKAKKYVIYGNRCGKSNKMKKLAEVTGGSKAFSKVAGKKVAKGRAYKFIIVALDKNNNVVSTSKMIHAYTKGGKYTNHKAVKIKAKVKGKYKAVKAVSVKKGKSKQLKATGVKFAAKKKYLKHVAMRFESSKTDVATVSSKGVVKGKKKGTCYVYAYSQNGVAKKIKVTVK